MAVSKYKATSEYRDPVTGTLYLDGTGSSRKTATSSPTSSATATKNGTYGNVTIASTPSSSASSNALTSGAAGNGPGSNVSNNVLYGTSASGQSKTTRKTTPGSSGYSYDTFDYDDFDYDDFKTSGQTDKYASTLHELENNKPDAYSSKYESTIQGILNNILNRKSFSLDDDANYQQLYDNYKERYQTQADKAMRDTLASANAATGGYGSTYGQAAAQQAYDNTMQGLNDNNLSLMQLAYQMYGDETADRYNQLSAVTGLDNTDYSRYRDTVSDYYNDLDYYANRYDTGYANDYQLWSGNRDFAYQNYVNDRDFDYTSYLNDRNLDYESYINDRNYDLTTDETEYSRYQDALNYATQLASAGMAVPDYITSVIDAYNKKKGYGSTDSSTALQQLAAAATAATSGSSSGSGKSSSKKSSGSSSAGNKMTARTTSSGIPIAAQETVINEQDQYDKNITNRNGNSWVQVPGLGRLTFKELSKKIDSGEVIETVKNGKYTYRRKEDSKYK